LIYNDLIKNPEKNMFKMCWNSTGR